MTVASLMQLALGAILVENFVLIRYLGVCPFLGVSKKTDMAIGMGFAVTFVMTVASVLTYIVNTLVLINWRMEYLNTMVFVLIIAGLVQLLELFLRKSVPALYAALGIYLPLITTNCAVLGVTLISVREGLNFIETTLFGCAAGIGFTLAITLFASIRERTEYSEYPKAFEGFPIALVTAAILGLAFMGFSGVSFG